MDMDGFGSCDGNAFLQPGKAVPNTCFSLCRLHNGDKQGYLYAVLSIWLAEIFVQVWFFRTFAPAMDTDLLRQKVVRSIFSKIGKATKDYRLIEEGDHILIGLSGGKDSLALVEFLGERMKIFVPRFRLTAVHVSMENIGYRSDLDYLENCCGQYGIPFIHHVTKFDDKETEHKSTCFLCSWYRRKALFEVAEKTGCCKIALGHHKDDVVETLLLNMIFQGTFGTMPPKLKMDKFDMTIIRPLCLVSEAELAGFAALRNYPQQLEKCPFEKESARNDMKQLVQQIRSMNPNASESIWRAMENIKSQYLPNINQ